MKNYFEVSNLVTCIHSDVCKIIERLNQLNINYSRYKDCVGTKLRALKTGSLLMRQSKYTKTLHD